MIEIDKLHELQELAIGFTLLYVEDNDGLREQAHKLFKKFFPDIILATNGLEGLELFKEHKPKLVITDIKMPEMDGLEMARNIMKMAPQTKIMVTSAFDDKNYLMEALNIGVFKYLKKPLNIDILTTEILDGLKQIKAEKEDRLFNFYIKNIFNHQKNLLVLYHSGQPVIVNNTFLSFFNVDDLDHFILKYGSLGDHFLPHKDFLYNHDKVQWFKEAVSHSDKLFHVKMYDQGNKVHHFIFKMIPIEDDNDYYLVSMDDITELGLLKLFDEKSTQRDEIVQDRTSMMKLLESAKRNNAEIKLQNFYKGLTITNKGLLSAVNDEKIELRTTFLQQKGVQNEGKVILSSELFPSDILCEKIKKVDFEKQTVEVDDLKFIAESPTKRSNIRLEPEPSHTASLFYQDHKFGDGIRVLDISVDAAKLSILSLPAGFAVNEPAHIDIVFTVAKKPVIVNTKATVYDIRHLKHEFNIILKLDLSEQMKKVLVSYLSQRQMALIREFKGLKYG